MIYQFNNYTPVVDPSSFIHPQASVTGNVIIGKDCYIGHGAVIHGATIGKNCLVGMNAVIMDNVILEEECIVGALSFIKADEHFERRSLIEGN